MSEPSQSLHRSERMEILNDGIVAPLTKMVLPQKGRRGEFDGGVYYDDGAVCLLGLQIKGSMDNRPGPIDVATISARMPGCHIFGGLLQNRHFGHFITESISRLWAANLLSSEFRSIVFYLRSLDRPVSGFVDKVLAELAPGCEVSFVKEPTAFEYLAVPEQLGHAKHGFIYGHPANQRAFRAARRNRAEGPRKVYVSRSALKFMEGGVLLEGVIEENLRREGYAIIHPQELSIKEQLDIYAAADYLVFSEGSAMHLYALMARAEQHVFVVWRRKMSVGFDWQIRSFGGPGLLGSPTIRRMWVPGTEFGAHARARAELDFDALKTQLVASGFISGTDWRTPGDAEINAELDRLQELSKDPFVATAFP